MQRSQRQTGERRLRRTGWQAVIWPLALGLAFCALGLWSGLVYTHNQAAFRAQAVPARAVIDQIYAGPPLMTSNGGGTDFNQYGLVHFAAGRRTAHARVLLVAGCTGPPCIPIYRTGQVVTVYYSSSNLSYAQLRSPDKPSSDFVFAMFLFGFFALIFLFAAAVNAVAVIRGA